MIRNCIRENICLLMQLIFLSTNNDDVDWSGLFSGQNSLNLWRNISDYQQLPNLKLDIYDFWVLLHYIENRLNLTLDSINCRIKILLYISRILVCGWRHYGKDLSNNEVSVWQRPGKVLCKWKRKGSYSKCEWRIPQFKVNSKGAFHIYAKAQKL